MFLSFEWIQAYTSDRSDLQSIVPLESLTLPFIPFEAYLRVPGLFFYEK